MKLVQLGLASAFGAVLVGCSLGLSPSIRFVPGPATSERHRAIPNVDQMDCYFVTADGGGVASGVPSCTGIQRSSTLVSWSQITGVGVVMKVPLGLHRKIRVWGVGTAGACTGKDSVPKLFSNGARPDLYPIGELTTSAFQGTLSVPNGYVAGRSPNFGACDGPPPTPGTLSNTRGLWRGGYEVGVDGSGFVAGLQVRVGGVLSPQSTLNSGTSATFTMPQVTPGQNKVVEIANPGGGFVPLGTGFTAASLYLFARFDGTDTHYHSYWLNPQSGALDSAGDLAMTGDVGPTNLKVHPSGKWFFVSEQTTTKLRIVRVNRLSGALQDTGTAISATDVSYLLAVPGGRFVKALQSNARIVWEFHTSDETLTTVFLTDTSIPSSPRGLGANGAGDRLFAIYGDATLRAYGQNASGDLIARGTKDLTIEAPFKMVIHPTSNLVYMLGGFGGMGIAGYSYDSGSEIFSLINSSSDTLANQYVPLSIGLDGGQIFCASNGAFDKIVVYQLGADGGLSTQAGNGFNLEVGDATSISVDPTSSFAAVTDSMSSTQAVTIYPLNSSNRHAGASVSRLAAGTDAKLGAFD